MPAVTERSQILTDGFSTGVDLRMMTTQSPRDASPRARIDVRNKNTVQVLTLVPNPKFSGLCRRNGLYATVNNETLFYSVSDEHLDVGR